MAEPPFELRPARSPDAETLSELGICTFRETFAKDNRPEDLAEYLTATFAPNLQLKEIQDPSRRVVIAWSGATAMGYYSMRLGAAPRSVPGTHPIELSRLYVRREWHGKRIAQALMESCLEVARREDCDTFWLGVWEHNLRAQAFYKKYSFNAVGSQTFMLGADPQHDIILVRAVD